MVSDVTEKRLISWFTEGLLEPLRGWVKAFDPPIFQDLLNVQGIWSYPHHRLNFLASFVRPGSNSPKAEKN